MSNTINYQTLLTLHQNYIGGKHCLLSKDLKTKMETKYIWFPIEEIRSFLEEVIKDKDVSGLKFYLIQYPNKQMQMDTNEVGVSEAIPKHSEDVSQLSIGLVTTKLKDTGIGHVDYIDSYEGKSLKLAFAPPLNHGQLCPTRCPD